MKCLWWYGPFFSRERLVEVAPLCLGSEEFLILFRALLLNFGFSVSEFEL